MTTTLQHDQLRAFGQTDQGLMRSDNEDCLLVDHRRGIFAVADGLGGLPEGSMASEVAIKALADSLKQTPREATPDLPAIMERINRRVYEQGRIVASEMGIGTTLTLAHIQGRRLRIAHVGDSGLVVFNNRSWHQITRDHTMAQDMLDRLRPGEHAYIPEYFSHTLTRCIGQLASVESEFYEYELTEGDRILLFTDGVTKTMSLDEIHSDILHAAEPEPFVTRLIDIANDRGGPDNITAIAIFVEG